MKLLFDNDPMPFGKHKGTRMEDVPASYLHWLWTKENDPLSRQIGTNPVAEYINSNLVALMREHPDGIWS
jgi:hypothetical protein